VQKINGNLLIVKITLCDYKKTVAIIESRKACSQFVFQQFSKLHE